MWVVETCHLVTERLAPARALDDEQAFALYELLDDVTLARVKAGGDVKTFSEELFG